MLVQLSTATVAGTMVKNRLLLIGSKLKQRFPRKINQSLTFFLTLTIFYFIVGFPTILTNMSSSDIKVKEGDLVNLLCSAQGEPPIIFYWEKDQKTVKSSVEIDKPHRSSFLVLTIKNKTSFGQYTCHIRDRFQTTKHVILVKRMEDCNYEGNLLTGSLKNEILFTALVGLNKIHFLKIILIILRLRRRRK